MTSFFCIMLKQILVQEITKSKSFFTFLATFWPFSTIFGTFLQRLQVCIWQPCMDIRMTCFFCLMLKQILVQKITQSKSFLPFWLFLTIFGTFLLGLQVCTWHQNDLLLFLNAKANPGAKDNSK